MNKQNSLPHISQIGPLDSETHEIIELIDAYPFAADFFKWLSTDPFTQKILIEDIFEDKYTRVTQYFVGGSLVFTGKAEFKIHKLPKEAAQFLTSGKVPIDTSSDGFTSVKKVQVSKLYTEMHYSIISHFHNGEELGGVGWEIFELPVIIQLYSKKNDPLRHWRNG